MRINIRIITLTAALISDTLCAGAQNTALYPIKDCSRLQTQMELNQCAGANYEAADTALNNIYRQLMGEETDTASRQRLTDAERAWIAYRDKECAYEIGPQQSGGSIWPMEMSNCLEEKTAAHIRELSKLRGCTAGVSACNPH